MSTQGLRSPDELADGAAQLLIRLGIGVLAIALPCGEVVSRRLIFSLMPVGAVLVVIGALLSPKRNDPRQILAAVLSPAALTALFLVAWSGLSLAWTPFPASGAERFFKTTGTVLLAAITAACLPDRSKTSNLNLLPIGVAAASLATGITALYGPASLLGFADLEGSALERSAVGLIVLMWPALGALAARARWLSAGALAVAVAVAAIIVWTPVALGALVAGALALTLASLSPRLVGAILAAVFALAFLFSPALPLIAEPLLHARGLDTQAFWAPLGAWATIVKGEGLRLLTGHGLDTAVRGLAVGYLPALTPRSLLFEIWYDFGIVGAVAAALLVARAFLAAAHAPPTIAPFLMAGLVCGLVIAISGLSTAQLWWVTLISFAGIAFAVVGKGQYRTERPVARVVNQAPPQPAA